MKKQLISRIFGLCAVILSCLACAITAYRYRDLVCAMEHGGASAPPSVALLLAVPYAVAILVCLVLWRHFAKK